MGRQATALKTVEDALHAARTKGERAHGRLHRVREVLAAVDAEEDSEAAGEEGRVSGVAADMRGQTGQTW